jgi:outer membrane protein, heavy metal efflux system
VSSKPSAALLAVALAACAGVEQRRQHVALDVQQRVGQAPDLERRPEDPATLPPGVSIDDGLSADEAVAIAVWNHPRVFIDLARLDSAQADLAEARRPSNPTLRVLAPAGPQQLAALLTWPLENLVLMRRRIEIATTKLDAVEADVVQTALDLGRDVRLAHAEWMLAVDRLRVRQQLSVQANDIAALAEARAAAGDVALREGDAARADAQVAADEAVRAEQEIAVAHSRLRTSIGYRVSGVPWVPSDTPLPVDEVPGTARLERAALASRPDLRGARLAIEAAKTRIGLERLFVLRFAGVANLQGRSVTGGVQAELPIANQNQGGIGRAKADLDTAAWRYQELRQRVLAELEQADTQRVRARASLAAYRDSIVSARQRDIEVVTAAYELGEQDYTAVLLAEQRLEAARLREVELVAELRRAHAELDRALGRRLTPTTAKAPR